MIANFIHQLRAKHSVKKQFNRFMQRGTNLTLQDNINNLPRPDKSLLRILCTSDSMRQQAKSLKSEDADYMVVNSFVLDPMYKQLKPKYYVLADPSFYGILRERLDKIFDDTTWPETLFVSYMDSRKHDWLQSRGSVTLLPTNSNPYAGPAEKKDWCYDHNLAMPPVVNVLNMAIYIGIYLGYETIELYGVEHSWLKTLTVGDDNRIYRVDSHFYDTEKVQSTVYEYFFNGIHGYHKLHELLYEYANTFKTYWELRELAERHNCRIINCTPNSYIDAFERNLKKDE